MVLSFSACHFIFTTVSSFQSQSLLCSLSTSPFDSCLLSPGCSFVLDPLFIVIPLRTRKMGHQSLGPQIFCTFVRRIGAWELELLLLLLLLFLHASGHRIPVFSYVDWLSCYASAGVLDNEIGVLGSVSLGDCSAKIRKTKVR